MINKTHNKILMKRKKKIPRKPIEFFINKIIGGDALEVLKTIPDESIDCVVTSPPYWGLRDYGVAGQIGLESRLEDYLEKLLLIFDEIKRVLKISGTCFINLGDTYATTIKGGHKNKKQVNIFDYFADKGAFPTIKTDLSIPNKSLCLIPSRFAIRMIEQGWILRNEIIWHKPNAMPESVKDRFTVDFEKLLFFTKDKNYHFKQQFERLRNPEELRRRYSNPFEQHKYRNQKQKTAKNLTAIIKSQKRVLQRGRNKRCVWQIATGSSKGNHFAVFPEKLIETPIRAGCPPGGIVLDPFMGSGTTAVTAKKLDRKFVGIELHRKYVEFARKRIQSVPTETN